MSTDKKYASHNETWGNKLDFLISTMGLSIGYGNVWRFPYLCYRHGGGAFLIPYFISVLLCGIPLLYVECVIGQMTRRSAFKAWKFIPLCEGIGIACTMANFYLGNFYIVLLSWTAYYLFVSFKSPFPWSYCDSDWATNKCHTNFSNVLANSSLYTDPVNEYFNNKVIQVSESIDHVGGLNWPLVGCMVFAYSLCYLIIFKGIKVSGKIMYVTAITPFILLLVLLGRSVTLKGASQGVKYFLQPDMKKLASIEIWSDAGTQIFFSYTLACGALTALGSHNKRDHKSYRDAYGYAFMNSMCSVIAGFVIFPVLGFMAHRQHITIDDVTDSGPGLAFVAYPRALSELSYPNAWAVLFFISLILLGIDGEFVTLEASVLVVEDLVEGHFNIRYRKELITLFVCFISFCISITMVTHGGMYVFEIFNYFPVSKVVVFVGLLEGIAIVYVYGYNRLIEDMKLINIKPPGIIFKWIIILFTPVYSFIIFILSSMTASDISYRDYKFPSWSIIVGWMLSASVVVPIVVCPIYNMWKFEEKSIQDKFKKLLQSSCIVPDEIKKEMEDEKINEIL